MALLSKEGELMKYTLKDYEYTFNASAKTITLDGPWNTLSIGQICRIKNLTRNVVIYDQDTSKMDKIEKYTSYSLTLSGAVITHACTSSDFADTDKFQIVIDTELEFTDFDTVLFENISVDPNGLIGNAGAGVDIRGDFFKTIFFKAIRAFSVYVQITDESGADPQWYTLCDEYGVSLSYTFSGDNTNVYAKTVPVYVKGIKLRVIAKNTGTVADTPYCGVI